MVPLYAEAGAIPGEARRDPRRRAGGRRYLRVNPTCVEIYSRLIEESGSLLRSGGIFVLEQGYNSAAHVEGLLKQEPGWTNVKITNDLAGIPRVVSAERT